MLEPVVSSRSAFEAAFPQATVQAIHGDAPYYNIIVTAAGELCSDFEHVTVGPVEWDIAYAGPEAHAAYDAATDRNRRIKSRTRQRQGTRSKTVAAASSRRAR
jgi:thiamine kinase-like enzyme